eukprot:5147791-Pyramimonas_sp.AAC.1
MVDVTIFLAQVATVQQVLSFLSTARAQGSTNVARCGGALSSPATPSNDVFQRTRFLEELLASHPAQ